jgi:hypothetical protein
MPTAQAQLHGFIAKYSPDVAKRGRAAIARMRKLLPAAQVLVYDNYNALAVGNEFGIMRHRPALYHRAPWSSLLVSSAAFPDSH